MCAVRRAFMRDRGLHDNKEKKPALQLHGAAAFSVAEITFAPQITIEEPALL